MVQVLTRGPRRREKPQSAGRIRQNRDRPTRPCRRRPAREPMPSALRNRLGPSFRRSSIRLTTRMPNAGAIGNKLRTLHVQLTNPANPTVPKTQNTSKQASADWFLAKSRIASHIIRAPQTVKSPNCAANRCRERNRFVQLNQHLWRTEVSRPNTDRQSDDCSRCEPFRRQEPTRHKTGPAGTIHL